MKMKDTSDKIMKLKEDLTLVSVDDSGALLDVEKRCYYDLNSTAFFIASLLENGYPYDEIQTSLISEFNVDADSTRPDIDTFIEELQKYGLLSIGEETIKYKKATYIKQGEKTYKQPIIQYNSEIAVSCAASAPS